MSELTNIGVSFIRTDGGTQARAGLNKDTVTEYADVLYTQDRVSNWPFPPLEVFYDGVDYWLADGFHRLAALRKVFHIENNPDATGYVVPCNVRQGTRRDAVLYATGANASHGLPRSDSDKRRAVETLLRDEEWGKWSDREIARRCRVSPTLVGKLRGEIVTVHMDSEPVERVYTTRHGTTATMDTSKIGAAAYEAIHSLQSSVLDFFKRVCSNNADVIKSLEAMKADHKSGHWSVLSADLERKGKVYRVNDLRQAVNNALDSMRFMASQATTSQPSEPAQDSPALIDSVEGFILAYQDPQGRHWSQISNPSHTNGAFWQTIKNTFDRDGVAYKDEEKLKFTIKWAFSRLLREAEMAAGSPATAATEPEKPAKHWGLSNGMAFWTTVDKLGVTRSGILEFLQPGARYLTDLNMTKEEAFARLTEAPRRADPYNPTQTVGGKPVTAAVLNEEQKYRSGFPRYCPEGRNPVCGANCQGCPFHHHTERGTWECHHAEYQDEAGTWWCEGCGEELSPNDARLGAVLCRACDSARREATVIEQVKPRIVSFVLSHFQTANEALVRIYTAIPRSRADDIHDFAALIATLERLERRIGAEYDLT